MVADFRLKRNIGRSYPRDYCVLLNWLVGGWDIRRVTKLYFNFNTPFYEFEKALQQSTSLCIIPPEEKATRSLSVQTSSAPAICITPPEEEATTMLAKQTYFPTNTLPPSHPQPKICTRYGKEFEVYTENGKEWWKSRSLANRAEKGYTVRDGPWICTIYSNRGIEEETFQIKDEASYALLMLKLQVFNKKYPQSEHSIIIMHVSQSVAFFLLCGSS
jgi:hypothetical protein